MSKISKLEISLVGVIIASVSMGLIFYFNKPSAKKNIARLNETRTVASNSGAPCPGPEETRKMADYSMTGMIEKDQSYLFLPDWYKCNPIEKGDIVALRYARGVDPVIRKVYGIPGDNFEVVFDQKKRNWNIKINGDLVMHGKSAYFFGGEPPPPLKLFEASRKGRLGKDELILFSSSPPGSLDSGILGVVNLNDVEGKIKSIK